MMTPPPPPSNLEAEQAVLCACLLNNAVIPKVQTLLEPKDFYRTSHQVIYQAIIELHDMQGEVDLITLKDHLGKKHLLEKVGGEDYLMSLSEHASTSGGYKYWCNILSGLSTRRKIINLCQDTIAASMELSKEVHAILSAHERQISELENKDPKYQRGVHISNVYTADRMIQDYADYIDHLKKNRFITGIYQIDKQIRGVAGGETLFIIARAGSFKTALLQNLLKNYINHSSWGATLFEIEMPVASLTERYMSMIQGSPAKEIEEIYSTSTEGVNIFRKEFDESFIKELANLYIVPTKVSIPQISKYIKLIEQSFKVKIGVIGIDYMGLLDGPGRGEYEIVSILARDCKTMAKELNLPVIVLCQTSREGGGDGDKEITLSAGRGSGAIEEAADFVIGLFQDGDDLIAKILKNRKGPKGMRFKLDLDPSNFRIGHEATTWEPPKKNTRERDGV